MQSRLEGKANLGLGYYLLAAEINKLKETEGLWQWYAGTLAAGGKRESKPALFVTFINLHGVNAPITDDIILLII